MLFRLERLAKRDDKVNKFKMARILETWEDFETFANRVERWYNKNSKRYMRYMTQYGHEVISECEFKSGMRDLAAPFSDWEIHTIYSWLDVHEIGRVDFSRLYEALYKALYRRFAMDDDMIYMNIEFDKKWLRMTFKNPTCDPLEIATTFEAFIHLGYTGAMLTKLIRERVPDLGTRSLVIFTDPARYSETLVKFNQKLYDKGGYKGGPKCAPKEGTIYYEYTMGHIDCPLLLDVWAGENEKSAVQEMGGNRDANSPLFKDQTSSN